MNRDFEYCRKSRDDNDNYLTADCSSSMIYKKIEIGS